MYKVFMGDCDLAIKSPDFLLFFNGESKMTNIGAEMRSLRNEKKERRERREMRRERLI